MKTLQRIESANDAEGPQVVASLLSDEEAAAIVNYLGESGITAHVWGTKLSPVYGEGITRYVCQIVVPQVDRDRAITLIANFRHETAPVDWDEVDVGEPE